MFKVGDKIKLKQDEFIKTNGWLLDKNKTYTVFTIPKTGNNLFHFLFIKEHPTTLFDINDFEIDIFYYRLNKINKIRKNI